MPAIKSRQSIVDQLKDPRPAPGRLHADFGSLEWDTHRIRLTAGEPESGAKSIPLPEVLRVQLSRSDIMEKRGWWARLWSLPAERRTLIHADIRTRTGVRLRFMAEVQPGRAEGLPEMRAEGWQIDWKDLRALLHTLIAAGARLAQLPTHVEEEQGERSLGALEQLTGQGLPRCFRVGNRVLHIPLATVADIDAKRPHNNADNLELIEVAGHQVVIRTGLVELGQRVVFYPPGTRIPDTLARSLGIRRFLDRGMVQEVDIRGEHSAGLVLELTQIKELEAIGASTLGFGAAVDSVAPLGRHPGWVLATGQVHGREKRVVAHEGLQVGDDALFLTAGAPVPAELVSAAGLEGLVTDGGQAMEEVLAIRIGFLDRADGVALPLDQPVP